MDMDIKTSNTKLQDLNEDCLRHIFQYLNFNDKWRFYKVFTKWMHVSPGFWKISKFGVVHYLTKTDLDEWPDLMPNRKLNFIEFREIVLICGSTFRKLSITLCSDSDLSIKLAYSFDGTVYHIDGEFSYEATLDILGEACCDLKTLEIRARECHLLLSEKFHALFLANKKLAEVHLDSDNNSCLHNILRLKDVPGPAKVLHLNYGNWSKCDVDKNFHFICDLLESRKINLKKLSVGLADPTYISQLLKLVVNYAKGLQVLEVFGPGRMEELSALEELEELSLHSMKVSNKQISAIVNGCKKLKKVKLRECRGKLETGINTIIRSLPELVSVSLLGLDTRSILQTNAQLTSNLQRLNICDLHGRMKVNQIKRISLITNLEELCVSNDYMVIEQVISVITDGCRKLKKVVLKGCKITCKCINTIMTTLPNLESVELSYIPADVTLLNDIQLSVRSFKLSNRSSSEDDLKKISLFKNLEVLDLKNINNLTDEVLVTIASACKKLKKVFIEYCHRVTGGGINSLVISLPNLETLELKLLRLGSLFLTQESNLQRLVVYRDDSFPHSEFETLIAKLPRLKHLTIH